MLIIYRMLIIGVGFLGYVIWNKQKEAKVKNSNIRFGSNGGSSSKNPFSTSAGRSAPGKSILKRR